MAPQQLSDDLQKIVEARHHDPFAVLGRHASGKNTEVRVYVPHALEVTIAEGGLALTRIEGTDLFFWEGPGDKLPEHYRMTWRDQAHREHIAHDPYTFPPQLPDDELVRFGEGQHPRAYRILGAHPHEANGIAGVLFAVCAPNAERVSVVGDFNHWDGRAHPMRSRQQGGIWELFIPDLAPGTLYKYEIRNRQSGSLHLKSDPYGRAFEVRPNTASIVPDIDTYEWHDEHWSTFKYCQPLSQTLQLALALGALNVHDQELNQKHRQPNDHRQHRGVVDAEQGRHQVDQPGKGAE